MPPANQNLGATDAVAQGACRSLAGTRALGGRRLRSLHLALSVLVHEASVAADADGGRRGGHDDGGVVLRAGHDCGVVYVVDVN